VSDNPVPDRRGAIVGQWLARTLGTYPFLTSGYLLEEKDRFRNPVGHALREALPTLVDELLGGMNVERIAPSLDQLVRMRAVQDFSASQAVGFVFLLRDVLRCECPDELTPEVEQRIDQMALLAFDLFVKCREAMEHIRTAEARRGVYVLDRLKRDRAGGEGR
jgi:RsbT co-antagonist protein rsbRD N-terminal domain